MLELVDKHFVETNELHQIFDRNKIKVSYCTMRNMKDVISSINMKKLNEGENNNGKKCHHKDINECPVNGKCHYESTVYKATVSTEGRHDKYYYGLSEPMFKNRLRGHRKSFNHVELRKETELSKYVWVLKNEEKEYDIKWEIVCRTKKYSPERWYCSLCTAEKISHSYG